MTNPVYTEIPADGIDVTHLVGSARDRQQEAAFDAYTSALGANELCPCYRHAKAVVVAYDAFYEAMSQEGGK